MRPAMIMVTRILTTREMMNCAEPRRLMTVKFCVGASHWEMELYPTPASTNVDQRLGD